MNKTTAFVLRYGNNTTDQVGNTLIRFGLVPQKTDPSETRIK